VIDMALNAVSFFLGVLAPVGMVSWLILVH
jgi:hypothetical protein